MSPDPLNKDCFFPPKLADHDRIARGLAGGAQNGGMSHVQRIHLSVGQYYFRFCDSTRFSKDEKRSIEGGWWADYEVFLKLKRAARRQDTIQRYANIARSSRLAYAAKLYLALPYEWGDCGALVIARLNDRLDAFKGRGLPAYLDKADPRDGGAKYIPMQDPTISQLYIPGLHNHFAKAFTIIQKGATASFA